MQLWLGVLIVLGFAACREESKPAPAPPPQPTTAAPAKPVADPDTRERFSSRGRVTAVRAKEIDIHHERMEAIRGYSGELAPMEAMVMPFAGSATAPITGIAVGDIIQFEFTVHYDSDPTLRLTKLEKLPPDTKLSL